jgi:hypothetical protein
MKTCEQHLQHTLSLPAQLPLISNPILRQLIINLTQQLNTTGRDHIPVGVSEVPAGLIGDPIPGSDCAVRLARRMGINTVLPLLLSHRLRVLS